MREGDLIEVRRASGRLLARGEVWGHDREHLAIVFDRPLRGNRAHSGAWLEEWAFKYGHRVTVRAV